MTKRKTKFKKNRLLLLISIIITLVLILLLLWPKQENSTIGIHDELTKYGYQIKSSATKYQKQLFKELKEVLTEEKIDEEAYAKLVGQNFLADFFTLDNKSSKNEVGGTDYVYESFQSDFTKYAKDSVYAIIEQNISNSRKQALPVAKEIKVKYIEQRAYTYLDSEDEHAYSIDYTIEYEEDLGYQTEATLILVHQDHKLEIVKMN